MKQEQILKKVIEKAVENGWDFDNWLIEKWSFPKDFRTAGTIPEVNVNDMIDGAIRIISKSYYVNIIFSHDFAKAFWGEEEARVFGKPVGKKVWEIEIQQLALAKDRLAYLSKFLEK